METEAIPRYEVKRVPVDEAKVLGRYPTEADYDQVISGVGDVYDADTGDRIACVRDIGAKRAAFLLDTVRTIKFGSLKREGAQGMELGASIAFGYTPRVPLRRNYGSACKLVRDNPDAYERLATWAHVADRLVQATDAEFYAWFRSVAERISPDWRLKNSLFTTGYVNHTVRLTYHRDGSEMKGTWSMATVLKRGVSGGYTVFPEFRFALNPPPNSFYGFSAPYYIHGVTDINKVDRDGYRYAVILYTMQALEKCGTKLEELQRVQEWSTGMDRKFVEGGNNG